MRILRQRSKVILLRLNSKRQSWGLNPTTLIPVLHSYAVLILFTEEMVKNSLLPCTGSYLINHSRTRQTVLELLMCTKNYVNTEEPEGQGKVPALWNFQSNVGDTFTHKKNHTGKNTITTGTGDTKENYLVLWKQVREDYDLEMGSRMLLGMLP